MANVALELSAAFGLDGAGVVEADAGTLSPCPDCGFAFCRCSSCGARACATKKGTP